MVDFPGNVKNAVNKRIADETIQQFQINEFTVSCKELNLKRAILVHESNFTLYEAEYRGSVVAVKVVAVEETQQISNYIDAVVDLTSFASLSHDNISSFLGAGYTLNSENKLREIMIVTEPYERGTLRSLLKKSLDWQTKITLARDVARAISYLHDKSVIHGDIRISTILVNDQNQAKVVDFAHLCGERSRLETRTFNTTKGTVALSPEMARNHMYDFAADVYAFGMLLFELITEIPPNKNFRYRNAHGGFALLESELRAAVKPGCPAALEALAYSCCETKALRRVVASQVVEELDFILIELNRKPEDEVRPSPLRRTSSTTNKYAHLLLPSPSSMKQLVPAKAVTAEVESAVSAPAAGENRDSSQQAPAVIDTPTAGVQEKAESEGDAAVLSVPVTKALPETRENITAPPAHDTDDNAAPVAGPGKLPQRRSALPVTPTPRVNESPSVSAGKSVVSPSSPPVPSAAAGGGSAEIIVSKNVAETPDGEMIVASVEPVGVSASSANKKNMRRKGMFDASTAQTEDEVILPPQPVKSLSLPPTATETAPDNLSGAQTSGAFPQNIESDAWLGTEPELTMVKEVVEPQLESVGTSTTAPSDRSASAVSSVPAEETPDKKKKSRTRAKIDYAAEGPALPESAKLLPMKTVESSAEEHMDSVRPPAASSFSSSGMQGESKKTASQTEAVSVRFELPSPVVPVSASVPAAGNLTATTAPPATELKSFEAAAGSTASSPPVLFFTPPVTVAPSAVLATADVTKSGSETSETHKQAPPAAVARPAPPVPAFSAPLSPPAPVHTTTGPTLTKLAPVRAEVLNPAPPSAVRSSPLPVSVSQSPLEDAESRLFTVYAQPNFGSEYVTLNAFSQDLHSKEPVGTALSQGARSVATVSMPISSPAPPLLSQFALNSTSAAPVHGQEHAPAGSTKAVRAGAGRRAPPDIPPVPIPASIRALGEPPKEPAVPTAPVVPVIVTPVVATGRVAVESAPERRNPNIVPEPFKQHIRAIVETPERKKPASAVDIHRPEGVEPTPFVLSTPHADKTHPTNDFTDVFSPLSPPPSVPASAPVTEVATTTPVAAEGKVLSKKKSRSRNKLEAKSLTPIGSFMHSPSPAITAEPSASLAAPLQAPLVPPSSPQPLSVETAALFASPAEKNDDSISPKPLNSNQKRRQNRAQARAAAAAFATVATAAQEIVEGGPSKHSATGSSSTQESPRTEKTSFSSPVEAAEEPVIVYTPNYAPPPVPAVPASVSSTAVADFIAHPVEKKEGAPKTEFHSPPRPSTTTHTPPSSTATVMETPPSKAHHSPSRTPNGSLPVPAPHRHIHHFDLPSPQVTPPMHFPLAGAALLVPLPTPPESPCSPLPHKLEPAEALQTVFSDADVKIATGSPQTKAVTQATQVYSTPHRTVEKLNRFNELAAAELGSHHKTLRTKVLSPAAASQRAVLSAPAPVVTVPVVNAYEERLLMMEQRLLALAEENLALQRELQVAVTRPAAVVMQLPAVVTAAPLTVDADTTTSSTMSAAHQNEVTESENESGTETGTETESEVDVMQDEESTADLAVPARTPARSSFGAMFRDFDEVSSEQVLSSVPATQSSETRSVTHATSAPVTASFTQEVPPVSVEFVAPAPAPALAPTATPIGMVDALKSLEAMQTELRSQLTALNAPPLVNAAATAASAPSTASVERSDGETQDTALPTGNEVRPEAAKDVQAVEPVLTQVSDVSAIDDSTPTKASPVDVVPLTPAPQEFTPATAAPTPSAAETEQQLQAHIASAIDFKLGAVQAQIAQFSSMLNAILLAQSPQPQRAAAQGDDASQVNCPSSTHTSAFVTPSSIVTVGSIALGMGNDEDGPGGSPGGSTFGPQKLFSQIDQQSVFQDVSPLAQSCCTDSGFSEAPVLLRPSNTLQSASFVPETSSFVPHSQVIWTGLDAPLSTGSDDQRSHTLEPFSPNSNQGNDSEDALSEREESESESGDVDEQENSDNDEETTQQVEVLEVLTHKPSFIASTSTTSEVEMDIERPTMKEKEEKNTSPLASPAAPSRLPPPPSSPASSPAAQIAALPSSPAAKSPSMKVVLEPLEEVVELTDPHVQPNSNSSNSATVGPRLSEIIPQLMLDVEEEPLEAWEVKARRASTTTTVSAELPVQKPMHVASPKYSERKPSVKEASVSLSAVAVSEQAPSVMQDKIAPAEIVIPVAAAGPSGRASTPESRATSPFLRNRIPYPVEAEEGTPRHFPHLFGEPEDEPVEAPPEVKSVTVEEKTVDTESAVPSGSDFYAPFSPSKAECLPVGLREPMAFPPPPAEETHSPAVSVGSRSTGESSSVVDATDIEYPYSAEEFAEVRRTPPQTFLSGQSDVRRSLTQPLPLPQTQTQGSAAVMALHRHHEQQQRELLLQQEEQLQAELSVFGHHLDPSSHLIPNAHHHNVRRNPPAAFNSSSQSVQSALSAHNHHHRRSPPQPTHLPSPQPSSPPLQGLASSMKFLDQINRLKDHYDAKNDGQLSHVPQRKPLDYARSPSPAQIELRRPQAGPYSEKHRRVSPSSSVERIGDGYQPHSTYPASTAHAAQRLSPRSAHGAFHALRNSSPPPPLPRPLVHSDPYLAPHSYQAANSSFRSPSPPRGHSTPQQIHTQSTLTNSGGERARRQYEFANLSLSYPLPISPPDNEWEEQEEEEEEDFVDTRNAQRLESLTGALNNFLSVIEKCTEISESADLAVSRLDHNMSRLDQRSHRKILTSAERAAEISDRRSRSRERSDSLASAGKSASFAPQLSFYEPAPPPPPSAPATLSRYNSFRNSSNRLNDDIYDAKYVDNYEDTDEDETGANQSRAGSMRPRSRSNSNANVFDSTTSIAREPVHTKHFLSPSIKPALTQFGRADSTHSLLTSGSFRNGNITSSNSYFKAGLAAPLPPNSPGGLNIGNRSVTSKSPAAVRKPEGLPARKAAVPVQNSRKMAREDTAEPRRATRTDRATSFASTIGSVVSGLSSVGGGESAGAGQRPTNFTADLRRSADSDSILIDGRVHALHPKSSQGLLSILRQDSNDSEWTNNSRGRIRSGNSRASSPAASQRSRSNSRSRSRSGSPRAMSPVEILSKNKNAPAYSFRKDASPRKAF